VATVNKKFKLETFVTPPGIARQAFLNKPSTKYDAAGVFSVKLEYDPADVSEHIERFNRLIEERVAEEIRKNPKIKKIIKTASPFAPVLDDEGDETGRITLNFKRKHKQELKDGSIKINKVKLLDGDGNAVTEDIWSGSTLQARYFITPYFSEKDKEVGVSLKLTHVLVIDLVSGGEGNDDPESLGFGKVEGGYKAPKKTSTAPTDDEDEMSGEDSGEDDNADF
jgi:hypothetical protein